MVRGANRQHRAFTARSLPCEYFLAMSRPDVVLLPGNRSIKNAGTNTGACVCVLLRFDQSWCAGAYIIALNACATLVEVGNLPTAPP